MTQKFSSAVQLAENADRYYRGRLKKKKMVIIRSVDKKVDCSIDVKCYVQSFNSFKRYSISTLLLDVILTNQFSL